MHTPTQYNPDPLADARHAARLSDLINSSWTTRAIQAGIELGVFEGLALGPLAPVALAEQLQCRADTLERLLVALEIIDLCERREAGVALTSMGRLLVDETPGSLQPWARLWCGDLEDLWRGLAQSVREGRSVREIRGIAAGFDHLAQDAQRAAGFNRAMASNSYWVARAFAACELLSDVRCLVDVGGGQGALLAAALEAHPSLRGILFDLPHAANAASDLLSQRGLADRAQFVAGSFFESVPRGGDAYVLKSVLHDWGDPECLAILQQCRTVMGPGDRLFIIERLLQAPTLAGYDSRAWARSDLNMLVTHATRERREGEYGNLLRCAGFELTRTLPLAMGLTAIAASTV